MGGRVHAAGVTTAAGGTTVRMDNYFNCSADTADVRPFWGRALLAYGGTLAGLYAAGVLATFVFLRIIGYPIGVTDVGWPGSWHRTSTCAPRRPSSRAAGSTSG